VYRSSSRASVVTRTPRFSRPRVLPFGTIDIRHTFEQPREIDTVGRYLSTCSAAAPHESVCAVVVVADVHFRFECHAVGGVEGLFGLVCFGSNSIDGMEDGVSRSVGGVVGRVYLSITCRVDGRFRVESRGRSESPVLLPLSI
jgi:hypothetical protein